MRCRTFIRSASCAFLLLSLACGRTNLSTDDKIITDKAFFSKTISEKIKSEKDFITKQQKETPVSSQWTSIVSSRVTLKVPEGEQPRIKMIQEKYGQAEQVADDSTREQSGKTVRYAVYHYGKTGFMVRKDDGDGKVCMVRVQN